MGHITKTRIETVKCPQKHYMWNGSTKCDVSYSDYSALERDELPTEHTAWMALTACRGKKPVTKGYTQCDYIFM